MTRKLFIATNMNPLPSDEFRGELVTATAAVSQVGWEVLRNFGDAFEGGNDISFGSRSRGLDAMVGCDAFIGVLKEPGHGLGAYAIRAAEELMIPSLIFHPAGVSFVGLAEEGPYFYPQEDESYESVPFHNLAIDLPEQVAARLN